MVIPPISPFNLLNTTSLALAALPAVNGGSLPPVPWVPPFSDSLQDLSSPQSLEAGVVLADLLQAEFPAQVVDTTILQAEVDAGMALSPFNQGGLIRPPSQEFPRPGQLNLRVAMTALNAELAASVTPSPGLLAEVIALSPATLQLVQVGPEGSAKVLETQAQAQADLAVATVLQAQDPGPLPVAGSTLLQAELAAYQTVTAPVEQAQAAEVATLDALSIVYQQAVLTALQAGVGKVSLILTGPSAGMAETLAGSGWVQLPSGNNGSEAEAAWSFAIPFAAIDVPAVTATLETNAAGVKGKPDESRDALAAYGSHGEQEPAPPKASANTLDILD